ncbi:hypothetical protein HOLleu_24189 [Holothuria leucospilota]|uniref:Uncharacterized protein n=1 Tax=Holothuria leucospilota TaxID=206669 RepID=A0A9Q1BVW8_HOLLE|nr:hypothetical protein HOLleu_24189 [Holothuria leucospilota]
MRPTEIVIFCDASEDAFGAVAYTSVIALPWIRGQSRQYKSFVANRVAEIQNQTDPADRRHLPGEQKIADILSRGIGVNDLEGDWKNGQDSLRLPEEE